MRAFRLDDKLSCMKEFPPFSGFPDIVFGYNSLMNKLFLTKKKYPTLYVSHSPIHNTIINNKLYKV